MVQTILFRTLSLLADIHMSLKNFEAARHTIKDLEQIIHNDAETYILKIKILLYHCAEELKHPEKILMPNNIGTKR